MAKKQKLRMLDEIKRIEQELYLKRSELASAEAMEYDKSRPSPLTDELDVKKWHKVFSELITRIGLSSSGGNSVEDVKRERDR